MPIPPLDYVESKGTRWNASALSYLLALKPSEIKAELQRLLGEEPIVEPTTNEVKEP